MVFHSDARLLHLCRRIGDGRANGIELGQLLRLVGAASGTTQCAEDIVAARQGSGVFSLAGGCGRAYDGCHVMVYIHAEMLVHPGLQMIATISGSAGVLVVSHVVVSLHLRVNLHIEHKAASLDVDVCLTVQAAGQVLHLIELAQVITAELHLHGVTGIEGYLVAAKLLIYGRDIFRQRIGGVSTYLHYSADQVADELVALLLPHIGNIVAEQRHLPVVGDISGERLAVVNRRTARHAVVFQIETGALHIIGLARVVVHLAAVGAVDGLNGVELLILIEGDEVLPLGNLAVHDAHRVLHHSFVGQLALQSEYLDILGRDDLIVESVAQLVVAVNGDILQRVVEVVLGKSRVSLFAQGKEHIAHSRVGFSLSLSARTFIYIAVTYLCQLRY